MICLFLCRECDAQGHTQGTGGTVPRHTHGLTPRGTRSAQYHRMYTTSPPTHPLLLRLHSCVLCLAPGSGCFSSFIQGWGFPSWVVVVDSTSFWVCVCVRISSGAQGSLIPGRAPGICGAGDKIGAGRQCMKDKCPTHCSISLAPHLFSCRAGIKTSALHVQG